MISTTFKVQTIGEILSEARRKKQLSLKQVAEITKIRAEYLKALEEGNYSAFASEVYLKGFLKNYAKFLEIDPKRALALYRRENAEQKQNSIKSPDIKLKEKINPTLTPEKLIVSVVAIVAIAIIYYLFTQISYVLKAPYLKITAPIEINGGEEKSFDTQEDIITIKGEVSPGATLALNGNEVVTNNLKQFEINNIRLTDKENEFILIATSQFGKESVIKLRVNKLVSNIDQASEEAIEDIPEIKIMNITLNIVNDDANVLVITDGQTKLNQVLVKGATRTFTANNKVIIQTPRPKNVKITINDQTFEITTSTRHEWELVNGEIRQIR